MINDAKRPFPVLEDRGVRRRGSGEREDQGSLPFQDAQFVVEIVDPRGVSSEGLGDIDDTGGAKPSQGRVPQRRHHLRAGTLPNPARILTQGDVAHVMGAVFDRPMAAHIFQQPSRVRTVARDARNEEADFACGFAVAIDDRFDLARLGHAGPVEIVVQRRCGPQRATLATAVFLIQGRRRVQIATPDVPLPRGKKPLPWKGRTPSGCRREALVGFP